MGKFNATFDGGVVAEPELRTFDSGARVLSFPVYVNERRKSRDSGEFEDTGNVTKIRVQLWNEAADTADVQKNDIVEVQAALTEREFDKNDGTKGRSLETTFVDSVKRVYRAEGARKASGGGGFLPDEANGFA